MACGGVTAERSERLVTTVTDIIYVPYVGWISALGVEKIKGALLRSASLVQGTGNHQFKLAIQVAKIRTDKPEPWKTVGPTWFDNNGEDCTQEQDISGDTDGALFVRFGIAHRLSAGTASLGQTDCGLQVGYESCGGVIGGTTLALKTSTTEDCYSPVSGFLPAMTVDRIMASIVTTSSSGNFQCRLAYRTATASQSVPGAWSTTFDAWHAGDGEWNTGLLTPTLANDMWVQIGLQYALSSGTSPGQGTVSVLSAVRKV